MVLLNNKARVIRPAMLALFCLALLAFITGCEDKPDVMDFAGETMGTSYHITVVDWELSLDRQQLKRAIERSLFKTNQQMSHYLPDSELNELSKMPIEQERAVSPEMAQVLALSEAVSKASDGAFDITVAPLVDLWGFGPGSSGKDRVPSIKEINTALALTGFTSLKLTTAGLTKSKPVILNLSAVAKGFGADQVALVLEGFGVKNYLIEIGGEMLLRGKSPRNGPWRIAIEKPDSMLGQVQKAISISDRGVATSGDYRNYFEQSGVRYSHTIDPRTGKPISHTLASVTVIGASAAEADAWATAIMVLGAEQGLALAEQKNLAIYMLVKQGEGFEVKYSSAFSAYLQ